MRLKSQKIQVPDSNPFEEDVLNRLESAEILSQLLLTISEPLVLAIDSTWGTGKTTFIRMWRQQLINTGFPTIYFNAWENDISDDPLVSLIGEVELGLKDIAIEKKLKPKIKNQLLKVKKIGSTFLKRGLPAAIKIATYGALDTDKLYEQVLSELTEDIAKDKIDKYVKDKSTIKDFKNHLNDFVKLLVKASPNEKPKPLVFFIDELDRCRPTFAIELLEKAKHFFNVENIIFILAIDKGQLGNSLKTLYGAETDVDGYLRRFIDMNYHLPEPDHETFCNALFEKYGLDEIIQKRSEAGNRYEKDQLNSIFSRLFKMFNFSLRVQEHCFSRLSIALHTTPFNYKIYPVTLSTLISLKEANQFLYRKFIKREIGVEEVLDFINRSPGGTEFLESNYGRGIEADLVSRSADENSESNLYEKYEKIIQSANHTDKEKNRARGIIEFMKEDLRGFNRGSLDYLVKKIEIAERFS